MYTLDVTTGIVTRDADSVQVAPAQDCRDPNYSEYVAWIELGNSPTLYTPPEAIVVDTKISVLAFRNRFTQTEKVSIDIASIDNPAGTAQQRQLAAMLRVMMADIMAATFIDLSRPDTIAGVQAMEQYGILATGRAAEILTTPISNIEVYIPT